ncbi:Signal peptidase complex subunit 3 protein [Dioscorea alata]|uniref:Signal peptidase complex subunit 3 protein n=1 Tax=Dioscorea alata TaxID=55571 RepID=A0ACB7W5B1_DIOAL|nr:Signal peptidase complex subunit 3 protein [Dioscorea alata]
MHTSVQRLNTLVTFAAVLLAVLCGVASFFDGFNTHSVHGTVEVVKIRKFRKQLNGNEEVTMNLNISLDMQSTFTWNTKQISIWDHIIPDKEHAKFQTQVPSKYPLTDQGSNLKGKKIDLVLHWHIMPKSGKMIQDKLPLSHFYLPEAYL